MSVHNRFDKMLVDCTLHSKNLTLYNSHIISYNMVNCDTYKNKNNSIRSIKPISSPNVYTI